MRDLLAVGTTWAAVCLVPGIAAAAPTGSITNVQYRALDGVVVATFTASSDVPDSYWYPAAWQQPLGAGACSQTWRNHIVYVGNGRDKAATTTESDYFYPDTDFPEGGRICLSVSVDGEDEIVAESTWAVPPAPKTDPEPLPTLTVSDTRAFIRTALRRRFRDAYRVGYGKKISSCKRRSRVRVRCGRVSWVVGDLSYRGNATIWYSRDGDDVAWNYAYTIKRTNEYCKVTGGRNCTRTYRVR